MLTVSLILLSQLLLISSSAIEEPSLPSSSSSSTFENIAFIKLGAYSKFSWKNNLILMLNLCMKIGEGRVKIIFCNKWHL